MLSTELSTIGLFFVAFLAAIGFGFAVSAYKRAGEAFRYGKAAVEFTRENAAHELSRAGIDKIELSLSDLEDRHHALLESHKRLRSRVGMRELRKRRKEANGEDRDPNSRDMFDPNTATDAEKSAYKVKLREEMKQRGLLK
jgi:hypothetical protein